ncbi:hypothetical protein E2562_010623 [Oryza meyeriana var. granulata]|uniref:Uncharacterized protein n=1 Tax=Oryza meyeriana var. granulata TaxID=110450 RepID=A0A6G1BUX6_9ORYZ|nr:hypothetical protein E2562_010623 [Oryza meyeriana var. granulata]
MSGAQERLGEKKEGAQHWVAAERRGKLVSGSVDGRDEQTEWLGGGYESNGVSRLSRGDKVMRSKHKTSMAPRRETMGK